MAPICYIPVDEKGRELAEHGTAVFPIACYSDDLSNHEVPWHWHEELEAGILLEGCMNITAGTQKYTLCAGDGFLINTGILHRAQAADCSICRFHSIVFHPRIVGGSIDSIFHQKYVSPIVHNVSLDCLFLSKNVLWQNDILKAVENTWQIFYQQNPGYEFIIRNYLSEIICLLQYNFDSGHYNVNQKSIRNSIRAKKMIQYIHDHFSDQLTISQIAKSASISNSECMRCFHHIIGMTPIQYLKEYRLHRACQMLSSTNELISDIALQCGFHDFSYFTKTFRETRGITPGEYRRTLIQ